MRWAIQNERARLQAVADAESAALAQVRENHNKAHAMRRRVFKGLFLGGRVSSPSRRGDAQTQTDGQGHQTLQLKVQHLNIELRVMRITSVQPGTASQCIHTHTFEGVSSTST